MNVCLLRRLLVLVLLVLLLVLPGGLVRVQKGLPLRDERLQLLGVHLWLLRVLRLLRVLSQVLRPGHGLPRHHVAHFLRGLLLVLLHAVPHLQRAPRIAKGRTVASGSCGTGPLPSDPLVLRAPKRRRRTLMPRVFFLMVFLGWAPAASGLLPRSAACSATTAAVMAADQVAPAPPAPAWPALALLLMLLVALRRRLTEKERPGGAKGGNASSATWRVTVREQAELNSTVAAHGLRVAHPCRRGRICGSWVGARRWQAGVTWGRRRRGAGWWRVLGGRL